MLQSLRSLTAGKRYRTRDLIGILFALAIGIVGQFILSDPQKILAPSLPMISPPDWPGSQYNTEPLITGGRPWSRERSFMQSIVLIKNNKPVAEATQVLVWYADRSQAAAAWEQHKREPYYDFPVVASTIEPDKPASLLFCSTPEPDIQGECGYRAYWRHWYTYVTFYGGISEDFPLSEMQKITDKMDQHLMSALDKPCQGFFCTSEGRNDISLAAVFIFVILLMAAFALLWTGARTRTELSCISPAEKLGDSPAHFPKAAPKEEPAPSPPAEMVAESVPKPAPNIELESAQIVKTEILPKGIQALNWLVCFIIASYVAYLGYDRLQHNLLPLLQLSSYSYWFANSLAFISPTCIAVAWLRLTGVKWRQALLLFPFVPVGVQVIYFIGNINN